MASSRHSTALGYFDKLARFRIKELKDILTELGLPKQGKKQDLFERVVTILSDTEAYKVWAKKSTLGRDEIVDLIEDTYSKMQATNAIDLATTGEGVSNNSLQRREEHADRFESQLKIRCLCENPLSTESMIKCDDLKCCVWQHLSCVIIPDKPVAGGPNPPELFYCEICRLSRADPFLVTMAHPLNPVKLKVKNVPIDGSNPVLHLEKTFQLTRADKDLLSKKEYDVQAWCMLVNDQVPFRMQWPQYPDLQVNGMPVRATNRPGSQVLGSNGRDDGPIITQCTRDGLNKISLAANDTRTFCFGVRLIKRRSLQQIRNLVPEELDGESIEEALARVRRCIGGGSSAEDTDSDNELVVIAESHVISLRCPMSGSRIKVAGRFRPCVHLGGFDLDIFLEMNQRSRKWQCPICLKNYSLADIIIDPFFNRIASMMQNCSDDITDIEVKPDGCWRVKTKNEVERRSVGELALWHFSNGSRCNFSEGEDSEKMEMPCRMKQEGWSESPTGQNLQKVVPMSISASGSFREEDDHSVNQDGYGTADYISNGIEYDCVSLNFDPANQKDRVSYGAPSNADVIVLSDSEDDEPSMVAGAVPSSFTPIPEISLDLPFAEWANPFEDCSISLVDPNNTVSPSVADVQNIPANGPSSTNGDIAPPAAAGTAPAISDAPISVSEYLLPFGGADPSLQTYPLPVPSNVSMDYEVRDQMNVANGIYSNDWISLRLGDSQGANNQATPKSNGLDLRNQPLAEKGAGDPMTDHATLLLGLTDRELGNTSRPRFDSPFSFPRQKRSVRQRTYLSIDSD
uniref:E3 SUMO-protein ligase SIZ1 n=1 Tax=Kalanchoe fedtschenkoi TaxID=63787 RepID=A0A7N0R8M3_KALFE